MTRKLLTLNGVAVLCVVLYHATAWGYTAMFWWTDRYWDVSVPNFDRLGNFSYYGLRFIEQWVIFAIPAFIFVSGYFIAFATQREQRTIGWSVILNRVKHLIIPYLIWSILILSARWMEGVRFSPGEYLTTLLLGRAADPYYYIPLLIQLYLIAPFLVPLVRRHPGRILVVSGFIQLVLLVMRYPQILNVSIPDSKPLAVLTWSGFFATNIFWFCFGMVAGFHLQKFKDVLARIKSGLPLAALIFFVLGIVEWELLLRLSGQEWLGPKETLIDQLYSAMLVLSFLTYSPLPDAAISRLSDLGGKSFGIYLVHAPVMEYSARLVYHFMPALLGFPMGLLALLIALSLTIPMLLMAAVNRTPARVSYKYIFG